VRLHKSGRRIDISATISPIYDENGGVVGASKIAHDVTAHKLVEKRVGFLATHDRLTELPNRDLFYDRLSRAISQARRKHQRLAVLFLDLDGFKAVNDQFGHEVGDVTLKEAARRLQASVRDVDTVARLGGDEFAIVLSETQGIADVRHVAEKVIRSISKPMTHNNGTEYGIGVSIGIAQFPDSGGEIDNLMKAADDAMYASKRRGRNCISVSEHVAQKITQASQWVTIDGSHLLGVKEIDEQHQKVADYLNALNSAVYEMMSHGETMRLLDELIEYVSFHFESEEKLMDKSSYPESNDHKDEHHRLVAEVRYLKARFVQGGELFVLQWLKDWLFGHVAGADRRLGEFLKTPQSE
jgi:diguanylate cyclase (GGDEF)-like protein/hemerythrin-like metal-binding protein